MTRWPASVTPRSSAIVLVNPNNPTGSFLKQSELGPADRAMPRTQPGAHFRRSFRGLSVSMDQAPLVRSLTGDRRSADVLPERSLQSRWAAADEARLDRYRRSAAPSRASFRTAGTDRRYLSFRQRSRAMGRSRALGLRGELQAKFWGAFGPTGPFFAGQDRRCLSLETARHRRRLVRGPGSAAHSKRRGMGVESAQ